MQRWEYLTISYQSISWSDSLGRTGRFPDAFRPATSDVSSGTGNPTGLLNELGEQGWERISSIGQGRSGVAGSGRAKAARSWGSDVGNGVGSEG